MGLCVTESSKGIGGFTALADNDDEGVFLIDRISIAKFAGKIGFNRNAGQLFDHVFSGCTGMIGRAAGNDGYFRRFLISSSVIPISPRSISFS